MNRTPLMILLLKKYSLLILFFVPSSLAWGQDINGTLAAYFSEVRSGKHQSVPRNLFQPKSAGKTLSLIAPYLEDTLKVVRSKAYAIVQLAGTNAQSLPIRQDAVSKLSAACKDGDSGNMGAVLGYLTAFRKEDFTMAAKDALVNLFRRKTAHYDKLIKLIGFLEMKQVQDDLRTLSQESSASKKDRWAAMLALARMGDNQSTENIMSRVRKMTVNDDVVYQLFPDLLYTRQREAIALLIEALNSDVENCMSADAEHDAKIPCGYRVMEMLAPVIEDYPLAVDESGDIDTKDYVSALKTVREWFIAHPDCRIDKDRF